MIDSTQSSSDNQCKKCHTYYVHYGIPYKWTYINGHGPYCEKCIKKGVTVTILEKEAEEKDE